MTLRFDGYIPPYIPTRSTKVPARHYRASPSNRWIIAGPSLLASGDRRPVVFREQVIERFR
jgi:hypothetical protein